VETEDGPRELKIFKQLELALFDLEATQTGLLFVDQICINQNDISEKAHQVGLMKDIYSVCNRTIVWLGPGTRASDEYFSYIRKVTSEGILSRVIGPRVGQFMNVFDAVMDPSRDVTESEKEDRDDLLELISRYGEQYPLDGAIDVLERTWFNRLWTIQEACLAPGLMLACGQQQLCFDCFRSGALFFSLYNNHWLRNLTKPVSRTEIQKREHILEVGVGLRRITQERKAIHQTKARQGLYDIVLKYNVNNENDKVGATLAEDRLFGLYGLTADDDTLRAALGVDYRIGVTRVYSDAAVLFMRQNMDVLLFSQAPKRTSLPELPSWVPDWSISLRIPHSYRLLSDPMFTAGGPIDAQQIHYDSSHGRLTLRGVRIGRAIKVGEHMLIHTPNEASRAVDSLDYRSVKRFFSEARDIIRDATASRPSTSSANNKDDALTFLRISDAGLTLKEFTDELGDDIGRQKTEEVHQTLERMGDAVIHNDNTIESYHISRIIRTIGIVPWYATPISTWEIMSFIASDPVAAGRKFMSGAATFITDITCVFAASLAVSWTPWYVKFRRSISKVDLKPRDKPIASRHKAAMDRFGLDPDSLVSQNMNTFTTNIYKNAKRKLYRTSNGYVGLGPESMKSGDLIVVFLGSTVPHIIRPEPKSSQGDMKEIFSYVGEAYCDGMMDGEALLKRDGQFEEDFTLE
jgi:hypothetical protein